MTLITCHYRGQLRCEAEHGPSGSRIGTDAPTDNHGLGQAFSPTDLLSTSLAACVATIMGIHVHGKDYDLLGIDTQVQKTMAANPRRVAAIVMELDVRVSAQATDQDLKVLERVARACPVAQSLHPDVKQDLTFRFVRA